VVTVGSALSVLAVVSAFVFTTNNRNEKLDKLIDSDLPKMRTEITNNIAEIAEKVDTLTARVEGQKVVVVSIQGKVDALGRSYTQYLLNDQTLTKEEFYEYMDGIYPDMLAQKKN